MLGVEDEEVCMARTQVALASARAAGAEVAADGVVVVSTVDARRCG